MKGIYATALAAMAAGSSFPAFSEQSVTAARYIHTSAQAGAVTTTGAVRFSGAQIEIPIIAVEPGNPDTTFEVHDKVNPTLIVPAGARLRFTLANADGGMPHALDVTASAPPYREVPHLSMTKSSDEREKTNDSSMMKKAVATTGVVAPNNGNKKRLAVRDTDWFTLKPGTYYYVCPIRGHAKQGMYGKLVVR